MNVKSLFERSGDIEAILAERLLCPRNRTVAFGSLNWNFERKGDIELIDYKGLLLQQTGHKH